MASEPLARPWREWYRKALPAYWIFLTSATHFPRLQLFGPPQSDKAHHFVAFGVLAFLWWRFGQATGMTRFRHFTWGSAALLGAYAACDEWTQQYVGRGTSLDDFLADLAGIALVLGVLHWRERRAVRAE